ncbi:MAG: hypothetical protein U0Q03_09505 [Acidimicrobiales bacterium]
MNRKLLTGGLLAGLIAGAGAGLVLEQTGLAGASSSNVAVIGADDPTTTVATDSSTDPSTDTARPDPSARLTEILQPLVDDGTITADQLTKIVAALDAAGPMGGRGGDGDGDGGMGRMGGRGLGLEAAATAIGISVDDLRTALEGGQTIAEVAAANGVDAQTVIDELVTAAGQHLAEEVTEGDLTQDEADARLAELTTRITDMVNNGLPAGGPMGGGMGDMGGMGRGHHGPGADDDDAAGSTSTDGSDASA